MLNGRIWLLLGVAAAGLFVAVVLFQREPSVPTDNSSAEREVRETSVSQPAAAVASIDTPTSVSPSVSTDDESVGNDTAFRVDTKGELVLDEQTRLNIERLIAQTEPNNLYAETSEQIENLPPSAARQAQELIEKFVIYQQAQRQIQPPDVTPPTEDDAVRQLQELHALREAHFGAEVARRFYGNEEGIAREMIEVMRLENDQSLTPGEKLERARALREQLPGVAAIEKGNRESGAIQKQSEEK